MKGIFYSTIAVLFITPLVLFAFANLQSYESTSQAATTKLVGDKLAAYASSIDNDLPRAMTIMGKRAVTQAITYLEDNGTAYTDAAAVLQELIENGTIHGNSTGTNFTAKIWAQLLQEKGERFGFNTNTRVVNISFSALDSSSIVLTVSMLVNVSYPTAQMELDRIYTVAIPISITDFNDPLYTLQTNGVLKREIRMPSGTISGPSEFDLVVSNAWYLPSVSGPGFLDRLEGRLVPSGKYTNSQNVTGLESVIYLPDLQASGISIKANQTTIDYLYFESANVTGYPVSGSGYAWLRIDPGHAVTYNLTLE